MARTLEEGDVFVVRPILSIESLNYGAFQRGYFPLSELFGVNKLEPRIRYTRMANRSVSINYIVPRRKEVFLRDEESSSIMSYLSCSVQLGFFDNDEGCAFACSQYIDLVWLKRGLLSDVSA